MFFNKLITVKPKICYYKRVVINEVIINYLLVCDALNFHFMIKITLPDGNIREFEKGLQDLILQRIFRSVG